MRNLSEIFVDMWVCMRLDGSTCSEMSPSGYLPVFVTLNPQSTGHGPLPGPTLGSGCTGGFPACPGSENTRKDPRPAEKKMPMCNIYTYIVIPV